MTLNYPKGKKVNNGILKNSNTTLKTKNKNYSKSNLGMTLEDDINNTNRYYLENNIAVIHKKPTLIKVVKVDYKERSKTKILEAYYKTPSTTDYNGIYNGYYIDFDVKETQSMTSFPLDNIKEHQITHLSQTFNQGGISFLIISFKKLNKYFLTPISIILKYINENKRKSIPINEFKENCFEIEFSYKPRLDYLKIIDKNLSKLINEKYIRN